MTNKGIYTGEEIAINHVISTGGGAFAAAVERSLYFAVVCLVDYAAVVEMRRWDKDEIQGSLHCAAR
jgi:hypothetical protein